MSKKKLFIENFLIYGVGGILGKIISFIMVPIITRLMPNSSYYGISDLTTTVTSFATYVSIFGMYDAMYRMYFEKDDIVYKKKVCSTTLCFVIATSVFVGIILFIFKNKISTFVFGNSIYSYLIVISLFSTISGSTNGIVAAPTRMQNHKKIYLVLGLCSTLLSYTISIPMLLNKQYILALPVAGLVCGVLYEMVFIFVNHKWFSFKLFDFKLLRELLYIAIPLVPNFLIYWVFNSSDKLMIQHFLGTAEVGIYSVGAKLGHLSNLIYTAFAGGWQYFAFATMKDNNQVSVNSKIFEYLGIITFASTAYICALSPIVYKIIFTTEYFQGYLISPYLFMSPLMQMLYQVISNQFLVVKKTWPSFFILSSSAIINVILNFILIRILGIEGAAISTLAGFSFSVVLTSIVLNKMDLFKYSIKFIFAFMLMVIYFMVWRLKLRLNVIGSFFTALLYTIILLIVYYNELVKLIDFKRIFNRIKRV